MVISNIKSGETYYGIRIYKGKKYIGSHNGTVVKKRISYYTKDFLDMFLPELVEKCKEHGLSIKIVEKL